MMRDIGRIAVVCISFVAGVMAAPQARKVLALENAFSPTQRFPSEAEELSSRQVLHAQTAPLAKELATSDSASLVARRWDESSADALRTAPSAVLVAASGFRQSTSVNRAAWLDDYAVLKHTLEWRYSNLAWFGSPESGVDLPALDHQALAALQAATSDEEARRALGTFVKSFYDGHFSLLRAAAPAAEAAAKLTRAYSRQDAAGGCAALGYAPYQASAFSTPFETVASFHLLADGVATPFRAGTLTVGARATLVGIVRIPEFENTHPSLCLTAWTRDDVWDSQGKFLKGPLRRAVELAWYQALADLLRTFRAEGVSVVLVDIGNNSGGDDSGDIATRLFTARLIQSSPMWMSQDETASVGYFDEILAALDHVRTLDPASTALVDQTLEPFATGKAQLAHAACPMDWVWHERRPWANQSCRRLLPVGSSGGPLASLAPDAVHDARVAEALHWPMRVVRLWGAWTGPVYVLADDRTYSSAEMFAAVLQNNHVAKIIGQRTGGDGCGFVDAPPPPVLPHSQIRIRLPNCVRIRVDGTDEVAGVAPDLPVPPVEGEAAGTRTMRILTALLTDVGPGRTR